jgi:hypothetical protein
MTRPAPSFTIIVSDREARAAYERLGEPVPSNLQDRWSWPQGLAFILMICAAVWMCVGAGVATNALTGVTL